MDRKKRTAAGFSALPGESGYTRGGKRSAGAKEKTYFSRDGQTVKRDLSMKRAMKMSVLSHATHQVVQKQGADNNAGTEALNTGTEATEDISRTAVHTVKRRIYSRAQPADKGSEAIAKADGATGGAKSHSSAYMHARQKHEIQKAQRAVRNGSAFTISDATFEAVTTPSQRLKKFFTNTVQKVSKHPGGLLTAGVVALLLGTVLSGMTSFMSSAMSQGQAIIGSSYTAETADITGANDDYKALEANLQSEIADMESTHPDYDEYTYNLAEINHNPYILTSYLTIRYEDFTRDEVQDALQELFDEQYHLTLTPESQTRTRTVTKTGTRLVEDPETGELHEETYQYEDEEEYQWRILHVSLTNTPLETVIQNLGWDEDIMQRYALLYETKGNRDDLFPDDYYANPDPTEVDNYRVPAEALTDVQFGSLLKYAEKYLGTPYVWGGKSPSDGGFDCSGFVAWVVNHVGNGTRISGSAEMIRQQCTVVSASEARPGDLVFFQGTYNTPGASHIGIYVGNGMMLASGGDSVHYSNISNGYFAQHFMCYGRLPA